METGDGTAEGNHEELWKTLLKGLKLWAGGGGVNTFRLLPSSHPPLTAAAITNMRATVLFGRSNSRQEMCTTPEYQSLYTQICGVSHSHKLLPGP